MQQTLNLTAKVGDNISMVDTPALIVDLDLVDENIKRMMGRLAGKGVTVRPHTKTVKCPELAHLLLRGGARGICVAKLSEAEVMVDGGIEDILITTQIAGEAKCRRLFELLKKHQQIKIVVDSEAGVDALANMARQYKLKAPVNVLIEVNVGQNRAGVEPGQPAAHLARYIGKCAELKFHGVQGYEGHVQLLSDEAERKRLNKESMQRLEASVQAIKMSGIACDVVTTGGTGTSEYCAEHEFVNEVQPGSFVFMDLAYRGAIGARFECALTLVSTVISKPAANRVVIDAGFKSLSTDSGFAEPQNVKGASYRPAGDEHGILQSAEAEIALAYGDRVELIPSHIDTTVNLHDTYFCHRKGKIEAIYRIAGRGKVQ